MTSAKDTGFVASSALAGGRLNLELRDVPAAYSVITRDFIDAVGITNLNEAAEWAPNSMRSLDGAGGGDTFNITAPVTSRGVGNVYQLRQRNFFVYLAPMDSYSIERYDFGRGPNQVLFGNGTADGYEFIITANPTRAWRITANYTLPKVWNKAYAPITRAYVAAHADFFRQILADAGGMVGPDGVAVANPAIANPTVNAVDQTKAVNAYNAIYSNLANFLPDMQLDQYQTIGNAYIDYTFQQGRLKDLRLGGGINYRGRARVGYRGSDTIVSPTSATTAIDDSSVDGHTTVWAPAYSTVTLTVGYRHRLKDHREMLFNLRVNNVLNDREVMFTGSAARPRNGDYRSPARETIPTAFAYKNPINFSLTVTMKM